MSVQALNQEFMTLMDTGDDPPVKDEALQQSLSFLIDLASQARLMYIRVRQMYDEAHDEVLPLGPTAFVPAGTDG